MQHYKRTFLVLTIFGSIELMFRMIEIFPNFLVWHTSFFQMGLLLIS